ncbi:MAG: cytidine deaminase [Chitinophagales bacterium]
MKELKIASSLKLYDDYSSFTAEEISLFKATKNAVNQAYAPYSRFRVGAAVLLADGSIYEGNNQENAAYPSGLCAERVALFYASANKPNIKIKAIAVTIDYSNNADFEDIISPCGGCRQVIAEYEHKFDSPITVYLLGRAEKVCLVESMKELLPFYFSGDILRAFTEKK